jgi:beta-lactam-binding protein with PASTA domain/tRNA A-37 threonylcarbamoyl transferase component Bud32
MDNLIGRKLDGRYEIKEIIGVGGMAVVYKAYDCIDDRTVAVKVLKEEYLTNEDFKRRFRNESKAIAVLSHPNIVKVYDVSLGDKLQYIVMEYIDGITLKEYIDQQHVLTWKEALHFTVQILRALEHAHSKGIIHRDIKPQNIMMLEDGTIKVTDFGIARFASSETRTITDKAIGSVHYISPEQARGAETDERSDIYSVGVMLYEMLTGTLPFENENAVSVAIMQMQQEPKSPREINDQIPEGLEDITLRAMQKDPLQRYPSASAMLADIDEFKRNPSIHFEYKYFVDDNPTKYVDAINKVKGVEPAEAKPGKEKKKGKKIGTVPMLAGIAAAAVLFVLVAILGAAWYFGFFSGSGSSVKVPTLVGKQYTAVTSDTSITKTWTIVKGSEQYDAAASGTIIKQDPGAGTSVKKSTRITVTVSKGPRTVTVPNEVGKTKDDAYTDLYNLGFTPSAQPKNDDSVASGTVISTDPKSGTTAQYGSTVTIYYSIGPTIVMKTVPSLVGTKYDNSTVTNALQAAGFKLGTVTHQWSDSVAKGNIISTSPNAGVQSKQDTAVNIVVSSGKEYTITHSSGTPLSTILNDSNLQPLISSGLTVKLQTSDGKVTSITSTSQISGVLSQYSGYQIDSDKAEDVENAAIIYSISKPSSSSSASSQG